MKFEDVLDIHKRQVAESLVAFGEASSVDKVIVDVERSRAGLYNFYKAGQLSKQNEIDTLKYKLQLVRSILDEELDGEDINEYHTVSMWSDSVKDILEILK